MGTPIFGRVIYLGNSTRITGHYPGVLLLLQGEREKETDREKTDKREKERERERETVLSCRI